MQWTICKVWQKKWRRCFTKPSVADAGLDLSDKMRNCLFSIGNKLWFIVLWHVSRLNYGIMLLKTENICRAVRLWHRKSRICFISKLNIISKTFLKYQEYSHRKRRGYTFKSAIFLLQLTDLHIVFRSINTLRKET